MEERILILMRIIDCSFCNKREKIESKTALIPWEIKVRLWLQKWLISLSSLFSIFFFFSTEFSSGKSGLNFKWSSPDNSSSVFQIRFVLSKSNQQEIRLSTSEQIQEFIISFWQSLQILIEFSFFHENFFLFVMIDRKIDIIYPHFK